MPSNIDYPAPVLFQICWNVCNPADLVTLASLPILRDRMRQFIHIYTSGDASSFEAFGDFVKRPLNAVPEEFTICLVEYEHNKLQDLHNLMNRCKELKQAKCLIGYNGGKPLDLTVGGKLKELPNGTTIYVAPSAFEVKSGAMIEVKNPNYPTISSYGVDYDGWNNNSRFVVGYGSKHVTIYHLKETDKLVKGSTLLDQINIGSLSCVQCDMTLPHFLNLESLGELRMESSDYSAHVHSSYDKAVSDIALNISLATLSSLTFPRLTIMELSGVKSMKNLNLPVLESLTVQMISGQKSDNPLVLLPPTIHNVRAPKCATIDLAVYGLLMPKIKQFEVPRCNDLLFRICNLKFDVVGHQVHNEMHKLFVPPSVTNVHLSGVDQRLIDMSSLHGKNVLQLKG